MWLHVRTYQKGGMLVLMRDDIVIEEQRGLPWNPLWNEDVMVLWLRLLLAATLTVVNIHAPKPNNRRKGILA